MAVAGVLVLGASAMAQDQNNNTTTTTVVTTNTLVTMPENDHLSAGDRIFLMDLVHANAREIELSRVAYHQANSPAISEYARHMLEDHRALQDQLMSSYGGRIFMKNWPDTVSNSYAPEDENWIGGDEFGKFNYNNWAYLFNNDWQDRHHLMSLEGPAFDSDYIQMMAADHAKLLEEIDRHAQTTSDDAIKTIINNCRPIVWRHLDHARDLRMRYAFGRAFSENNPW